MKNKSILIEIRKRYSDLPESRIKEIWKEYCNSNDKPIKENYILNFSNSNNVWYTKKCFYGTELAMLKYANKLLHENKNKFYNLWIYKDGKNLYIDNDSGGLFKRGKKLSTIIANYAFLNIHDTYIKKYIKGEGKGNYYLKLQ